MSLVGKHGLPKKYHKTDLEEVIKGLVLQAAAMKVTLKKLQQKKQNLIQNLESPKNETKNCRDVEIPRERIRTRKYIEREKDQKFDKEISILVEQQRNAVSKNNSDYEAKIAQIKTDCETKKGNLEKEKRDLNLLIKDKENDKIQAKAELNVLGQKCKVKGKKLKVMKEEYLKLKAESERVIQQMKDANFKMAEKAAISMSGRPKSDGGRKRKTRRKRKRTKRKSHFRKRRTKRGYGGKSPKTKRRRRSRN